jgi:hypothetical protein
MKYGNIKGETYSYYYSKMKLSLQSTKRNILVGVVGGIYMDSVIRRRASSASHVRVLHSSEKNESMCLRKFLKDEYY